MCESKEQRDAAVSKLMAEIAEMSTKRVWDTEFVSPPRTLVADWRRRWECGFDDCPEEIAKRVGTRRLSQRMTFSRNTGVFRTCEECGKIIPSDLRLCKSCC